METNLPESNQTFEYIKNREFTPKAKAWDKAMTYWKTLYTDEGADFDKELIFDGSEIDPMITFGTNPGMGMSITKAIPNAEDIKGGSATYAKSLAYMGFSEGESMIGKSIDYVLSTTKNNLNEWVTVKVNVKEDFKKFHNLDVNELDGLAIMSDTDNSKMKSIAYFQNIYFSAD